MKVLVLGGTGYLGSAIASALGDSGHDVVVASRNPGADDRLADLSDPPTLAAAVSPDIDAVVHAAAPETDWDVQAEGVRALQDALDGRRLLYTSGVWVLGPTAEAADESAEARPIALVSGRPAIERLVLERGGVVIRPGVLHGAGRGLVALLDGRYVGEVTTTWPMVHVDDAARLFVVALEKAEPGSVLHAVAEPSVPVVELATAQGGSPRRWDSASEELGSAFAEALALSQVVTAPAARALGWEPRERSAVADTTAPTGHPR
jgi:nucleoside-diphosphate-sugar epimerase